MNDDRAVATLKLQPFQVPNFVLVESRPGRRQDGFVEAPEFHLSELDVETLDHLCERFRRDVFEKAGKPDPKARP